MTPTSEAVQRSAFALGALMLVLVAACADADEPRVETETHFLASCDSTCASDLQCICGVCTKPCSSEAVCDAVLESATCTAPQGECRGGLAAVCDVQCSERVDCATVGAQHECVAGRCRNAANTGGSGGTENSGGAGDVSASGNGGQGGDGGGGQSAGQGSGGSGTDSGTDSGIDAGDGGDGDGDASVSTDCNAIGEPCCDPYPGDGPNYCVGARLTCGVGSTCQVNCMCVLGAYFPVCGVDGQTYDASCGRECVLTEIACDGQCPCASGSCAAECTGAAPDQEVVDACAAISDAATCTSFETGGFPLGCRWITASTGSCPPVP